MFSEWLKTHKTRVFAGCLDSNLPFCAVFAIHHLNTFCGKFVAD
jgi:hypothetical protein